MARRSNLRVVETPRTRAKTAPTRQLPIKSIFYSQGGKKVLKKISSSIPLNACGQALKHMRRDTYKAAVVEVYDMRDGKLHSVMKRHIDGSLHTVFQRKQEKDGE